MSFLVWCVLAELVVSEDAVSPRAFEGRHWKTTEEAGKELYDLSDKYIYPATKMMAKRSYKKGDDGEERVERYADVRKVHEDGSGGSYNVQTGDEFFLHDFDVRPKFKTKQHDRDVIELEYYGNFPRRPLYTTARPFARKSTTRRIVRNPSTTTRRKVVQTHKLTQTIRNKKRKVSTTTTTTKRPVMNSRRTTKRRRPIDRNKNKLASNKNKQSAQNCNRNKAPSWNAIRKTGNRKRPTTRVRTNGNENSNPTMKETIRRYLQELQNYKGGERRQTRKMFVFPTFEQIRNSTASFANNFLSLFTIAQFDNYECAANGRFGRYLGTCYSEVQCSKLGGSSVGDCANGYGVCCVFRATCGTTSNRNSTYLESPTYPNLYPPITVDVVTTSDPQESVTPADDLESEIENPEDSAEEAGSEGDKSLEDHEEDPLILHSMDIPFEEPRMEDFADSLDCTFRIEKASAEIRRVRIDFLDLELAGPTERGDCLEERLVVSGRNVPSPMPIICGYNSGHHYYVDVTGLIGPLQISILSDNPSSKRYKLLVSQLSAGCGDGYNCLQYYEGVTGTVSSFNYEKSAGLMRSAPRYMNNLNYAICIRREPGYCSITYNLDNETEENVFEIADGSNEEDTSVEDVGGTLAEDCPYDYIVLANRRICGAAFAGSITDNSSGPVVIPVRSNDRVTGRGFKLNFTQKRCAVY